MTGKCEAELLCQVTDVESQKVIYRETNSVTLLPKDYALLQLNDRKANWRYNLAPLLCAWIAPTDPGGALDRVRGGAAKYHPAQALVGVQASAIDLASYTSDVKALYEYLAGEVDLKFVNQPYYFDSPDGQRVLTADQVLASGGGNCIDLVILFASLLEGLGINPVIMLVPGHAFLGLGNVSMDSRHMSFLECTMLGQASFEDAREQGRRSLRNTSS